MSDDTQGQDGSFNEEELQDIMNEIESLEKDFSGDSSIDSEEASQSKESEEVEKPEVGDLDLGHSDDSSSTENDLQSTIDAEIAELNAIQDIGGPEDESTEQVDQNQTPEGHSGECNLQADESENVVNISDEQPGPSAALEGAHAGAPVDFSCQGEMNLNMKFSVGEKQAHLIIDKNKGLTVQLDGVQLNMNDSEGCIISLPGGVKFVVPLTSNEASATKKAS